MITLDDLSPIIILALVFVLILVLRLGTAASGRNHRPGPDHEIYDYQDVVQYDDERDRWGNQ